MAFPVDIASLPIPPLTDAEARIFGLLRSGNALRNPLAPALSAIESACSLVVSVRTRVLMSETPGAPIGADDVVASANGAASRAASLRIHSDRVSGRALVQPDGQVPPGLNGLLGIALGYHHMRNRIDRNVPTIDYFSPMFGSVVSGYDVTIRTFAEDVTSLVGPISNRPTFYSPDPPLGTGRTSVVRFDPSWGAIQAKLAEFSALATSAIDSDDRYYEEAIEYLRDNSYYIGVMGLATSNGYVRYLMDNFIATEDLKTAIATR